jgi:hypothetical protein
MLLATAGAIIAMTITAIVRKVYYKGMPAVPAN